MRKLSNRSPYQSDRSGWRDYQDRQRCAGIGKRRRLGVRLAAVLGLVMSGIFGFNGLFGGSTTGDRPGTAQASAPIATTAPAPVATPVAASVAVPVATPVASPEPALPPEPASTESPVPLQASLAPKAAPSPMLLKNLTGKQAVRQLFAGRTLRELSAQTFQLPLEQQVLQVKTSLDEGLQNYLLDKLDRQHSRYIGIVVMEADTGRVLAMAGFDKNDPEGNPCLRGEFPAASIFKIVTAASAVDAFGLSADSPLSFNGYKHTLYKRQLDDKVNRYTTTVAFKDAFAQSINPVFGKIGQLRLGKSQLEKAAEAFAFNKTLDFELPIDSSRFSIGEEPYNWAEIASGFNRETTISPLHGALIATAVLNEGNMVTPSLVDQIVDAEGNVLYHRQPPAKLQAMSPKASAVLSEMMEATISSGTSRKAFKGYLRDKVLSRLQIGGKTGSMGNATQDTRFDWFVGFAQEKEGEKKLAVAVMVGHEEYIGTRASQYARMVMTRYFETPPVVAGGKGKKGRGDS